MTGMMYSENNVMDETTKLPRCATVYLTRDWETCGIEMEDAYITERGNDIVYSHRCYGDDGCYGKLGTDAFEDINDAIAKVMKYRVAKILKLQKVIQWLANDPVTCGGDVVFRPEMQNLFDENFDARLNEAHAHIDRVRARLA